MFHIAASKISTRCIGRMSLCRLSPRLTNSVAFNTNLKTTSRRAFHDWGSPIPEPEFSPGENILLDVTAWFVALALVYSPSSDFEELEDTDNRKNDSHKQRNRLRSDKKHTTEEQDKADQKTSSDHHKGH